MVKFLADSSRHGIVAYFQGMVSKSSYSIISSSHTTNSIPCRRFFDEKSFFDLMEDPKNYSGILIKFVNPEGFQNISYKMSLSQGYMLNFSGSVIINRHMLNDDTIDLTQRCVTFENESHGLSTIIEESMTFDLFSKLKSILMEIQVHCRKIAKNDTFLKNCVCYFRVDQYGQIWLMSVTSFTLEKAGDNIAIEGRIRKSLLDSSRLLFTPSSYSSPLYTPHFPSSRPITQDGKRNSTKCFDISQQQKEKKEQKIENENEEEEEEKKKKEEKKEQKIDEENEEEEKKKNEKKEMKKKEVNCKETDNLPPLENYPVCLID